MTTSSQPTAEERERLARRMAEDAAFWAKVRADEAATEAATATGTVVRVPARFYDDHVLRDGDPGRVVKRAGGRVTVELDDDALASLERDARFYAAMGEGEFDRADHGIVKSARATLRALGNG